MLETPKQWYGIFINYYKVWIIVANNKVVCSTLLIMFYVVSGVSLCLCVHSVLKTPDTVFRINYLREAGKKRREVWHGKGGEGRRERKRKGKLQVK